MDRKDANGKIKTCLADALGRADQVWLSDRSPTLTPSYEFLFNVNNGDAVNNVGVANVTGTVIPMQPRPRP